MMLRSSRPLVVFEGKTDVMYVKRALEMLKSRVTDYAWAKQYLFISIKRIRS